MTSMNSGLTIYSGVPLDNSYENTFTSVSLLSNFPHVTVYSTGELGRPAYYIRPDRKTVQIEHNGHMNVGSLNLYKCNYITFVNANYENTRFYAFITDVRYVNDRTAEIDFEVDVMMTWLQHNDQENGCTFKECFVEREHTKTDNFGEHLIDEGLNLGSYVSNRQVLGNYTQLLVLAIGTSKVYKNGAWVDHIATTASYAGNKILIGLNYYYFTPAGRPVPQSDTGFENPFNNVEDLLTNLVTHNVVDAIKFTGYVPIEEHDVYVIKPSLFQYDNKIYRPKNQKLFSFPYMFISVDNCENSEAYYAFENFSDGEISGGFEIANDYISGTSTCIPKDYLLGEGNNTINKNIYPVLSTNSSPYNEYIGQLKAKYMGESVTNLLTTGIQGALIGGGVIGAGIGVTIGAFAQAIKAQTEAESAKLKSSTPTGAVGNLSLLRSTATRFEIRVKLIRPEIARSIDGFFTKFGYKVNELKTPSFEVGEMRLNWKFIKTNGCTIDGYAPATDMSKIEEIMDNGITFWKTENVGDYTFNEE